MKTLLVVIALLAGRLCYADGIAGSSLFAYTGYLTIPSAYVVDGRAGLHYSYFPREVAPLKNGQSENQLYSLTIGFLPFLETYFSVYVCPDIDVSEIYDNYGSLKVRSPGLKLKVLDERRYTPAVSIGLFDPNIRQAGAEASISNVSSVAGVMSKRFEYLHSSVSLGYGLDALTSQESRLRGFFGGVSAEVSSYLSLLMDYDSEYWSVGGQLRFREWSMMMAIMDGAVISYRFGRSFQLLH